jgi:hypothetical protein
MYHYFDDCCNWFSRRAGLFEITDVILRNIAYGETGILICGRSMCYVNRSLAKLLTLR